MSEKPLSVANHQGANEMSEIVTSELLTEYRNIVANVGEDATDGAIAATLVREGAWTKEGAHVVVRLARQYGTSILRNALALASAMQIEDGEAGL